MQSPAERHGYEAFLAELSALARATAPQCGPAQAAAMAYGAAALGMHDGALAALLVDATAPHLQQHEHQQLAPVQQQQPQAWQRAAGAQPAWTPSDFASLAWGLGSLGARPTDAWLDSFCAAAQPRLDE